MLMPHCTVTLQNFLGLSWQSAISRVFLQWNEIYLSSGSLIGDDPADDKYEAWYDGTGEPHLLGEEDGDLEYKGDIPKVKVVEGLGTNSMFRLGLVNTLVTHAPILTRRGLT